VNSQTEVENDENWQVALMFLYCAAHVRNFVNTREFKSQSKTCLHLVCRMPIPASVIQTRQCAHCPEWISQVDSNGMTPLHYACLLPQWDVCMTYNRHRTVIDTLILDALKFPLLGKAKIDEKVNKGLKGGEVKIKWENTYGTKMSLKGLIKNDKIIGKLI